DQVTKWVEDLAGWLRDQRPFTITTFIRVLEILKGKVPDALSASTIAYECREKLDAFSVKDEHVIALARGLSILVPDLVGVIEDKVIVNASAARVAEAIRTQLEDLNNAEP